MLAFSYALAVVLLTAPPGSPGPGNLPAVFDAIQEPLQELAVGLEILDPREVRYILARREDFSGDLNLLRRRYRDLANAPASSDADRFPDHETINYLLTFNRSYRQQIDSRQPLELVHWWELRLAVQETERLYQIWDSVRDARCDFYYVTVRRLALKRLQEMIGEEAYYAGNLPPCVPLWRFQQPD
jgi:hypothetical protein